MDNIGDGLGFRVYHIRESDYPLLFRRCFFCDLASGMFWPPGLFQRTYSIINDPLGL